MSEQIGGLVHVDTQRARAGIDLTVDSVYRLTGPGKLDFGGSEYAEAGHEPLAAEREHADDDYGWWQLDPGAYRVRYNESVELAADQTAQVYPHERLLLAGAHHPAFFLDASHDTIETLLDVGAAGCHLKENCRISRLVIVDDT